jgi:hypothetical protein
MGAVEQRRAASTFGRFSKLALKPRRMFFGCLLPIVRKNLL